MVRWSKLAALGLLVLGACPRSPSVARPHPTAALAPASQPTPTPIERRAVTFPPAPVEPADGEARHLRNLRQLTAVGRNGDAAFSADGQTLVFQSLRPPVTSERLLLVEVSGGDERYVRGAPTAVTCATFAGANLVFSARQEPMGWALWRGNAGAFASLTSAHGPLPSDARDATYAPGSDELFFSARADDQRELFSLRLATGLLLRLTVTPQDEGSPAPSSDGQRVAFWRGQSGGVSEIFLLDRRRGVERQLTALATQSWAPTLHPNGSTVLFGSGFYGARDHELLLVDVESAALERVTRAPGFDGLPRFAPDGQRVAFTSSRQGGMPQLFVADWQD